MTLPEQTDEEALANINLIRAQIDALKIVSGDTNMYQFTDAQKKKYKEIFKDDLKEKEQELNKYMIEYPDIFI